MMVSLDLVSWFVFLTETLTSDDAFTSTIFCSEWVLSLRTCALAEKLMECYPQQGSGT